MKDQLTYIKISDVALLIAGKNIDKARLNANGNGLPYIVGASSMKGGRLICDRYCDNAENKIISQLGDVIISTVGTLGKLAVNDIGDCILSKHVCAIRFIPSILPEYGLLCIMEALSHAIPKTDETKTGFARKLDCDVIANLPLLLITTDKQRETVAKMIQLSASFDIILTKKTNMVIPDLDSPFKLADWFKCESERILKEQRKATNAIFKLLSRIDRKEETVSTEMEGQISLDL